MAIFNEQVNALITRTELDSVFFQEFEYNDSTPSIATARTAEIFKTIETSHSAYIDATYKGVGLFNQVGETETVPLSTPKVTNKTTYPVLDFAQGIEISKDLFDDNMFGVWADSVRELAMKAKVSQDQYAFGIFRTAFSTTTTPDGVSWINSAHPLIGGGTQSNLSTGVLNDANFNLAIINIREQKDQAGVILGNAPAYLVVPSALFKTAVQLTESALVTGSGNNDLNVYRSAYGITVFTSPYLGAAAGGSDTAWFLLAKNHGIRRAIRQGLQTALRDWTMSNNRTYFYQANYREVVFVKDYAGSTGSTGL